jgi:putative transcriptional regulator
MGYYGRFRMQKDDLAPGLLLASPSLKDPNFEKTVILLGRHGEDGALGWVVNGRELMAVGELFTSSELIPEGIVVPDTAAFSRAACVGGPVAPAAGWLLYRRIIEGPLPGEIPVGPDLGVSGELAAFNLVLRGSGPREFRLVLGCAGWAPKQLETEIATGAWLPARVDAALVLDTPSDETWDAAYHHAVGASPAAFTSRRGKA